MIELKKNENESTLNLVKRFTKSIREAGILPKIRDSRFRIRPKSDLRKKTEALKRAQSRQKMERLRKLGKIEQMG